MKKYPLQFWSGIVLIISAWTLLMQVGATLIIQSLNK